MKVYLAPAREAIGTCSLTTHPGPFHVIRVADQTGRYRRVKVNYEVIDGEQAAVIKELELAPLLPGFAFLPGAARPKEKKIKLKPGMARVERQAPTSSALNLQIPEWSPDDPLARAVAVRILHKFESLPLTCPTDTQLPAGVDTPLTVALPGDLPEGNLLLAPAPGLPLAMEVLLDRVDLGTTADHVTLILNSARDTTLPAGAPLGTLEVRSPSKVPDGLLDKIFISQLLSKIDQARAELEARGQSGG